MHRDFHKQHAEGAAGSPPSQAWLIAQAILGKPIPRIANPVAQARAEREQLKQLAQISPSHAEELRRLQNAEADARRERELLEWAAKISTRAEDKLRALQQKEAEEREAWRRAEQFTEKLLEGNWDPSKHPRGAFAQNRGWWSPTGGSGATGSSMVPNQGEPGGDPVTPAASPATKPQLPADHRGTWIEGTKGNGVFRYNNSIENQQGGLVGKEVRFAS